MVKKILINSTLFIVLLAAMFPASVMAVPQPPHVFYGAVTVGGSTAADGLTVTAAIAGASFPYTLTAQTSGGRYGDDLKFKVPSDDPDTTTKEGGANGDTIVFYVEGVEAGNHTFAVGNVTSLDLSISALPALAAPANTQITTSTNDNTPTFTWSAVTNAVSYQIRIDFGSFIDVGNVTTYTFTTTIADGSHTFEVRGVDAQGTPGSSSLYSFTISTAAPTPAPEVGGGVGGGLAGVTSVLYSVTDEGRFTENVTALSADRKVMLFIPKDTIGLNRVGQMLSSISIKEMADPPDPPKYFKIIPPVYYLGPEGATFDPPIDLTISYDASLIPERVAEKNLVVATFNSTAHQWERLESTVNPETDTITAKVSHFSAFAVLAPTRPTSFTVTDLSITPSEAYVGESVSISVFITNTGDLTGSHEVSLKIDNKVLQVKEVTLDGGDSETIIFSVTLDTAREYSVNISGLLGSFEVKEVEEFKAPAAFTTSALIISPTEVNIGERVIISVTVTNVGDLTGAYRVIFKIDGVAVDVKEVRLARGASQEVVFTTAKHTAGTYIVDVDGLIGSFIVKEKAPPVVEEEIPPAPALPEELPTPPINWWLIGGIIFGVVAVGLIYYFVIRKRIKLKGSILKGE